MSRAKEVGTAVGTLVCALGIGFVMQSTDTASQRYGSPLDSRPASTTPIATNADTQIDVEAHADTVMEVERITLTSAQSTVYDGAQAQKEEPASEPKTAAIGALKPSTIVSSVDALMDKDEDCGVKAAASPREAAFVRLDVMSSCRRDAPLTIHHNGMMFTGKTDAQGALSMSVPALSQSAVFIVSFADGDGAVAHTHVSDLDQIRRVVLQWEGHAGFELHAREFGADYGETGHVWNGSQSILSRVMSGKGGILTALGHAASDTPLFAEVYSFPAGRTAQDGDVDLSVEAAVTETNCGKAVEAQTLEWDRSFKLRTQNLTVNIPPCESVGDYLVLNNVLDNLKVASN